MNVTFFRNRALRRDLETLRKDSHPGLMVGLKSMTGSLMRERRGRLKTQSGERLREDRWRLEGSPKPGNNKDSGSRQKLEERPGMASPSGPRKGANPTDPLISGF